MHRTVSRRVPPGPTHLCPVAISKPPFSIEVNPGVAPTGTPWAALRSRLGAGGRIPAQRDLPQIFQGLGLHPVGAMTPGRMVCRSKGAKVEGSTKDFFPPGAGETWTAPWRVPSVWSWRISCFNNSGAPGNCFPSYETSEKVLLSGAERSCKYVVCVLFHVFLSAASIQKLLRVPLGASTVLGSEVTLPSPPQPFLQMSPGWRKALRGAHYKSPLGFARCLARADGSPNSEIIVSL